MPETTKHCKACKQELPLSSFYSDKRLKDGHRSKCKACSQTSQSTQPAQRPPFEIVVGKLSERGRPVDREIAPIRTDLDEYLEGYVGLIDPSDYLLQTKQPGTFYNRTFGLYEETLDKDPHLSSVLLQRKSAVLSKQRELVPADETDEAAYAAAFIAAALDQISVGDGDSGFDRDLSEMLDAITYGISVSELLWGARDLRVLLPQSVGQHLKGMETGKSQQRTEIVPAYIPVKLLSRRPSRFGFTTDGELRLRTIRGEPQGQALPPYRFLVFRPYSRYEDFYGVSALRVIWWGAFAKLHVQKFWMRYLERHGDPLVIITEPERGLTTGERDVIQAALANLQQETGLTMPAGSKVDFVEAMRQSSTSVYQQFSDWTNLQMSKAIIGQTLTTEAGNRGARSLGEVHAAVASDITEQDARALMALVNGTLIPWIMEYNLPGYPAPRLVINSAVSIDKERDARWVSILQESGFPVSQSWVSRTFSIPPAKSDDDILKRWEPTPKPVDQADGKPTQSSA